VIGRLRPKLARVRGVSLFLNPVQSPGRRAADQQHLSIRAQGRSARCAPGRRAKLVDALKTHPDLITDVDIDQQDAGRTPLSKWTATPPRGWASDADGRCHAL
jgi:multidrug efflux pump